MAEDAAQKSGSCRCGAVQFTVTGDPLITIACHCTGCQRMTASAFSLSTLYPLDAFAVVGGDPVLGGLQQATRHYFCPDCKSWLYTRIEGLDDMVNVRATMLDDCRTYRPFVETCTDEKLPWAQTSAVHSFAGFPDPDQFPALLAEFRAWDD